ncbi:MAG: M24 family metallopeptidase [Acidobacteriota bacterium]
MTFSWSEELEALGWRALVVVATGSHDPYLAPFVGSGRVGASLFLATDDGEARLGYLSPMEREEAALSGLPLLSPEVLDVGRHAAASDSQGELWARLLSTALESAGIEPPARIGITGLFPAGAVREICERLEVAGWTVRAGDSAVERLRKRKRDDETAEITRVAGSVAQAFRTVARRLVGARPERNGAAGQSLFDVEGMLTVGRLRREIAGVFAAEGLEQPLRNIVAPGGDGAVPHNVGNDASPIRTGETLIVDLFPKGRLFADLTRTFCLDPVPADVVRASSDVAAALVLAESSARPGVAAWTLQQQVCRLLGERGWPTPISHPGTTRGYVHGLGHGVGYDLHELPIFAEEAAESDGVLEDGDILTLEPGLYDPEAGWAVRLEDLYRVTPSGVARLVDLPRELDPRAVLDSG